MTLEEAQEWSDIIKQVEQCEPATPLDFNECNEVYKCNQYNENTEINKAMAKYLK